MKPFFIATQRLWQLVCPPEFQAECLEPEKLWTLPRDDGSADVRNIDIHGLPSGKCRWERIPNRRDFLADLSNPRLCLTIDAGVGKTIALRQTEYLRQAGLNRDALGLRVDFAELPPDPGDMLPWLVRKLQNTPQTKEVLGDQLTALIERKIRQGRFTLLVDALDQSAAAKDPFAICRSLRDFLQRYPEVRCVVSGRPWSVHRYWRHLFEPQGTWQFAKIDVFTRQEYERFVGPKRFELLSQLQADVISIPRSLEMIRHIPDDGLSALRTKCDVYWRSLEHMQKWALQDQDRELELSEPQAWSIFSLVAFEMLRRGFHAGAAGVAPGRQAEDFMLALWKSRHQQLPRLLAVETQADFGKKLSNLISVCENVVDAVIEQSTAPKVIQFFWRNQTLMDMFAALWITRYADDEDRRWFAEHTGDDEEESWLPELRGNEELARLVAEMPPDGYEYDKEAYAKSLSFLYGHRDARSWTRQVLGNLLTILRWIVTAPGDIDGDPRTRKRRWTELIYRSWPNTLQLAGYLTTDSWTDAELQHATRRAQQEAWQRVTDDRDLSDAENPARDALLKFLGEFPLILRGGQGVKKQRVAEHFRESFLPIPPNDSCSQTFRRHWVEGQPGIEIAPFRMAATPVTRAQYELFEPTYLVFVCPDPTYRPKATCPATTSWYDAWSFATWVGCRLPTEEEWEYACRAGTDTEYSFGDDENLLGSYAWYDANSDEDTHPVASKIPNPWGLYDMHGNVLEWCQDWYTVGESRVLRSGSITSYASHCRSSSRGGMHPADWGWNMGIRVVEVCLSPSESS